LKELRKKTNIRDTEIYRLFRYSAPTAISTAISVAAYAGNTVLSVALTTDVAATNMNTNNTNTTATTRIEFTNTITTTDRLCGLVVRVLGYKSGGPGSIPDTTRKK
jgi:hypothetical protein